LDEADVENVWRPRNYTGRFQGPTRLREGLVTSRNLVSVRLLRDVGIPYTLDYIKRFGFDSSKQPHSLSLALGAGTLTPLSLTAAYATLANGGYHLVPYFVDYIENAKGETIYQAHPLTVIPENQSSSTETDVESIPAPRILEPRLAYLIKNTLQDVVKNGTGRSARVLKRPDIAGKTGTTNNLMDAWFAGFSHDVVTTVWVGFDKKRSIHEYAAQAALPIWIDFMREAMKMYPYHAIEMPSGIVIVRIDPGTGLLASPDQTDAIFELFREEYAPKATVATPSSPLLFIDEPDMGW